MTNAPPPPPVLDGPIGDPPDLLLLLPELVDRVAELRGRPRGAVILHRTFALDGGARSTLDDLAAPFGVTRERIRQIRETEMLILGWLIRYGYTDRVPGRRLRDAVLEELDRVRAEVAAVPIRSRRQLLALLLGRYERNERPGDSNVLALLMELLGERRLRPTQLGLPGERSDWFVLGAGIDRGDVVRAFEAVRRSSDVLLDWTPLSTLAAEVARHRLDPVEPDVLESVLALLPAVETARNDRGESIHRRRFDALRRSEQLRRVLVEHGAPLHFREITARANVHCRETGAEPLKVETVQRYLSSDDHFESVRPMGTWTLASWPELRTASVKDVVRDTLARRGRPTRFGELYLAVTEENPDVPPTTMLSIVSMYERDFVQRPDETIALPEWSVEEGEARREP